LSEARPTWRRKLRDGLRHAFALDGPEGLSEADYALLDRLAKRIVARRMGLPAVMFLSSARPLNSIGSQALVFLRPFLTPLINPAAYDRATRILDRREGLAALVDAIEAAQNRQRNRTP